MNGVLGSLAGWAQNSLSGGCSSQGASAIQGGNLANQAIGGLLGQAQNLANYGLLGPAQNRAYQNQMAQNGMSAPLLSQYEENVPDDELEFEGKLMRLTQQLFGPTVRTHGIQCCQRMLML